MGEVDWAHSTVTADASHWSLMALKHLTDTSFTASPHSIAVSKELSAMCQYSVYAHQVFVPIAYRCVLKCGLVAT